MIEVQGVKINNMQAAMRYARVRSEATQHWDKGRFAFACVAVYVDGNYAGHSDGARWYQA